MELNTKSSSNSCPAGLSSTVNNESNERWCYLYNHQLKNLQGKATLSFLQGLKHLNLPRTHIPLIEEVSKHLASKTEWELEEVNGIVELNDFFRLLANKKFPCTSFIRTEKEIGISKDPDIFHELFGHVPMLMDYKHSLYLQKFGELGLSFNKTEQLLLQRLFWFTYETGMVNTLQGHRIFGGSLLSSIEESCHVFYNQVHKQPFILTEIFRTPYRDDRVQGTYFVMESTEDLFKILDNKEFLQQSIDDAYHMGEYQAPFVVEGNPRHENVGLCKFILDQCNSAYSSNFTQMNYKY